MTADAKGWETRRYGVFDGLILFLLVLGSGIYAVSQAALRSEWTRVAEAERLNAVDRDRIRSAKRHKQQWNEIFSESRDLLLWADDVLERGAPEPDLRELHADLKATLERVRAFEDRITKTDLLPRTEGDLRRLRHQLEVTVARTWLAINRSRRSEPPE